MIDLSVKHPERRDKIIDGTISTLKKVGGSDLLFGLFLVCEGLLLIYAPGIFPVFVVLNILIAYAFAFEWFFRVIRGKKPFGMSCRELSLLSS